MAEQNWPVPKFHFRVSIGGETISFQEVSGLEANTDVIEYRHGDSPQFSMIKQAGLVKTGTLSLKKGVFKSDNKLFDNFKKIYEKDFYSKGGRVDIIVELLNESSEKVMAWKISNAFPTKLTGPDLKSDDNNIAIESMEFAYETISVEV